MSDDSIPLSAKTWEGMRVRILVSVPSQHGEQLAYGDIGVVHAVRFAPYVDCVEYIVRLDRGIDVAFISTKCFEAV